MECIGFNTQDGVIYEGRTGIGFRLQPQPLILPITCPTHPIEKRFGDQLEVPETIFREDSFDPVTRIRRGRVFSLYAGQQPISWDVHDPLRSDLESKPRAHGSAQTLERTYLYSRDNLTELRKSLPSTTDAIVILGCEPFLDTWKIISIETSAHGSPILTLRFQRSLSGIPEIDISKVPKVIITPLLESIESIENSNHRQGAVDVVDRCRATMSIILGELSGDRSKDLGKAITAFQNKEPKKQLVHWAAGIINRFHPRGKPNEQYKLNTRPLSEDDAQLAIGCIGLVLKEIDWAK